jgi:RNA polymerase sigma factor FliA
MGKNGKKPNLAPLWRRYKKVGGVNLRNRLIENYFPLVRLNTMRAKATLPMHVDVGSLESAAGLGLLQAVENFDIDRGVAFETFASSRIRGAILDWLRDEDWISRLSRIRLNACLKATEEMREFGISNPSAEEIAKHLRVPIEQVEPVMKYINGLETFFVHETEDDDDDDHGLGLHLESVEVGDSEDSLKQIIDKETFEELVSCLSDFEQAIILLYYQSDCTMGKIGELLGISESRVCQMHDAVILKLKDMFCWYEPEERRQQHGQKSKRNGEDDSCKKGSSAAI